MRAPSTTPADAVEQAMANLTAQWYNAVTTQCTLDPQKFQFFQGNTSLSDTSESMWNIVDVIPPLSINEYYDPSQLNIFSQQYGSVITNLKATSGGNFEADMGDYYESWSSYLQTNPPLPPGGVPQLFQTWAEENIPDTSITEKCYADLAEEYTGPVATALNMWLQAASQVKAYNNTVEQLQSDLEQPNTKTVSMDSATQSSNVSNSWAKGESFAAYDFFGEAEVHGNYQQSTVVMAQSHVTINATFQHLVTFPLAPLSEADPSDPILKNYIPWYDSSALSLAYQTNDNTLWNDNPPTWEDFFGPTGSMLRTCSALVVVDGITVTMTSDAAFSQAEQTEIQSEAELGIFPFYEGSASGGWSNNVAFDDEGHITVTQSSPLGNPVILGAIVTPIADIFS